MQINALNRLNPALQQGLIWGFILGIVQIAFSFISGSLGFIGSLISLALYLVFAWMAGQRASQRTGRTATGVWAGLLTGFVLYGAFHHIIHHGFKLNYSWYRRLRTEHFIHHQLPNVNFGVTSRFWDHIFGTTFQKERTTRLTAAK